LPYVTEATPEYSIGKFFGLAGIRAGFVLAEADILEQLNELLGPWALSNPTRFVTACALQNKQWFTELAGTGIIWINQYQTI
jgi:histidinol-phosphate/aromatic aminotransferase/cobyric acid decarboxylase-like protein